MIRRYAVHEGCRRDFILSYFGEDHDAPCGNCDNCDAGQGEDGSNGSHPFAVGTQVEHPEWGIGDVQRYDDDQVVVLFESVGYKTLGVELVLERGLLTKA
jgi:ATP-dependent DNA helicase RecQ